MMVVFAIASEMHNKVFDADRVGNIFFLGKLDVDIFITGILFARKCLFEESWKNFFEEIFFQSGIKREKS